MKSKPRNSTTPLKLGVLANQGLQQCHEQWQATATYLTQKLGGRPVHLLPVNFNQIEKEIAANSLDFVILNPGLYAEFEYRYGLYRIVTLSRKRLGRPSSFFGSVIFSRRENPLLKKLPDLCRYSIAAVDETSLGGWRMLWRELKEIDIDPYRDFKSLDFLGSHDAVVEAVLTGRAEVGTVSSGVLEQWDHLGRVDLANWSILPPPLDLVASLKRGTVPMPPFAFSTRLYPEWPFAVAAHVPQDLATEVAIALLQLSEHDEATQSAGICRWLPPLSYQPIRECFQVLRLPPYESYSSEFFNFSLALKGSNDGLWNWNLETDEVVFSSRWSEIIGYDIQDIQPHIYEWRRRLHPDDQARVTIEISQLFASLSNQWDTEYRLRHRDGSYRWILCRGLLMRDYQGKPYRMAGSQTDITHLKETESHLQESRRQLQAQASELQEALNRLTKAQTQLIQAEKMSGLGQLVAGIAHELNNPISFIHGNLHYLEEYVQDLLSMTKIFAVYSQSLGRRAENGHKGPLVHQRLMGESHGQGHALNVLDQRRELEEEVATLRLLEELDFEFIESDLPKVVQSMREGTRRIQHLVSSLRNFSRLDEASMKLVDLHEGIDSTLLILQHRLSPSVELVKRYGRLPQVECHPGQINQVFMNLICNAIDAVIDQQKSLADQGKDYQPRVVITTQATTSHVLVMVRDNGGGVDRAIRSQIFDPFFTTKPVGQGTGLGLSISYQIVVEQHHGTLTCVPLEEGGTRFEVQLPLRQ